MAIVYHSSTWVISGYYVILLNQTERRVLSKRGQVAVENEREEREGGRRKDKKVLAFQSANYALSCPVLAPLIPTSFIPLTRKLIEVRHH